MVKLEPKHTLFDSLKKMLATETLSDLLARPINQVECQQFNGHSGLAGSQLSYVETNAVRLVLKRMSITSDWIMFASNDRCCRSVTLWQYGLLDQLLPTLEHKIIACSRDGDGWAVLMEDLTGHVYVRDTNPIALEHIPIFLDRLARLHATFWNDPRLLEPALGLCTPSQLLDQTSLPMAQNHKHLSMGVIPKWVRDGWKVMETTLDSDVYSHMLNLIEHPQPLVEAMRRYPYTLLHGDYRAENLAHLDNPIAFDWQESTFSLMTIDLIWFAKQRFIFSTMGFEQAIQYYRKRLEFYLNQQFDDAEWQMMVELGGLFDALRIACVQAYWYKHTKDPLQRQINERELMVRNQQVRNGIRWL